MSHQATINIIGCLIWMLIGAAVLSATHRGLLDMAQRADRDESFKNMILPVIGVAGLAASLIFVWLIGCLIWPFPLLRFFQRRGLINGHTASDCPHRILLKEHDDKTRNRYRHGACPRRVK